jgi:non-canonical poly(A) RNA polymerase PAPD5/7
MVAKKKSTRGGGVTKRKGGKATDGGRGGGNAQGSSKAAAATATRTATGTTAAAPYRPPSHVLVHSDIGGEYQYDLEDGIDIGALGENVVSLKVLRAEDGGGGEDSERGTGGGELDNVEDVIHVASSSDDGEEHEEGEEGEGDGVDERTNQDASGLSALLADYERLNDAMDIGKPTTTSTPQRANLKNTIYDRIPWSTRACLSLRSPSLRLHEEIRMFNDCLRPTDEEHTARRDAVQRIRDVVTGLWPDGRLEVFGSFATGLYLPSSDIDAVILGSKCADIRQGLRVLAKSLSKKRLAVEVQTILKARVPIIKFVEKASGYNFDISFDVANGPEAADIVLRLIDVMPAMSHLVMVLKVFLQQRELSEVYTGGIGSYALLVMVANFMQTHRSRFRGGHGGYGGQGGGGGGEHDTNLGELLMDFFRLHGRTIANGVGVSCSMGGSFFQKKRLGFFQPERPDLYAVQDPNDDTNDLAKNSYNASKVRIAFDHAYSRLTAAVKPGESLLERIVRLDKILFSRWTPAGGRGNRVEVIDLVGEGATPAAEGGGGGGGEEEEEAFDRTAVEEAEAVAEAEAAPVRGRKGPKAKTKAKPKAKPKPKPKAKPKPKPKKKPPAAKKAATKTKAKKPATRRRKPTPKKN